MGSNHCKHIPCNLNSTYNIFKYTDVCEWWHYNAIYSNLTQTSIIKTVFVNLKYLILQSTNVPDWIDPHNRGKTWTERMTTHWISLCHAAHNLNLLQAHPFEIIVIETIISNDLSIVIKSLTWSCFCMHTINANNTTICPNQMHNYMHLCVPMNHY